MGLTVLKRAEHRPSTSCLHRRHAASHYPLERGSQARRPLAVSQQRASCKAPQSSPFSRGPHQYTSQRLRVRSVQNTGSSLARSTRCRQGTKSPTSKGVRKPRVPMLKLITGGKGVSSTNREVRCSTVPSPPRLMQKSTAACDRKAGSVRRSARSG